MMKQRLINAYVKKRVREWCVEKEIGDAGVLVGKWERGNKSLKYIMVHRGGQFNMRYQFIVRDITSKTVGSDDTHLDPIEDMPFLRAWHDFKRFAKQVVGEVVNE